jgi:FixJ family two-component response regulator
MDAIVDLIDDDEAICQSQRWLLELHGYTVRTYASAEDFLKRFERSDCLLVDHHMPGMTGLDLLEHLRAIGNDTPAIIISGQADHSMRERARRIGVQVLSKPLDEETLVATIEATRRGSAER